MLALSVKAGEGSWGERGVLQPPGQARQEQKQKSGQQNKARTTQGDGGIVQFIKLQQHY